MTNGGCKFSLSLSVFPWKKYNLNFIISVVDILLYCISVHLETEWNSLDIHTRLFEIQNKGKINGEKRKFQVSEKNWVSWRQS